jgi:hypothetical protein
VRSIAFSSLSQIALTEIEIAANNKKYIRATGEEPNFYEDEYQTNFVRFCIPKGKILAAYDDEGKLLRTVERFKGMKVDKKGEFT